MIEAGPRSQCRVRELITERDKVSERCAGRTGDLLNGLRTRGSRELCTSGAFLAPSRTVGQRRATIHVSSAGYFRLLSVNATARIGTEGRLGAWYLISVWQHEDMLFSRSLIKGEVTTG